MFEREDNKYMGPIDAANKSIEGFGKAIAGYQIGCIFFAIYLILLATAVILFIRLGYADNESFEQNILVEFSAGAVIFILAPVVFRLGDAYRLLTPLTGFALALAFGWWAYVSTGLKRSLLIEFAAGIILLIALEITVSSYISQKMRQLEKLELDKE